MSIRDIWLAKTDSEVVAAFNQVDQYTPETQAVIRAEYQRRSSQPHAPVTSAAISSSNTVLEESSVRRASLKAARDHLASLAVGQSAGRSAAGVSSSPRHESSSHIDPVSSRPEPGGIETSYEYKVVPFIGQSKGSLSADEVAKQLQGVIAQHAHAGWEFCQLSDVNVEVQPGCLAGLFGASAQYMRFDQLIFRKKARAR